MEFLSTTSGKLKIVIVVFSIVSLGIMADTYKFTSINTEFFAPLGMPRMTQEDAEKKAERVLLKDYKEEFDLAALSIAFIASVALIVASFLNLGKKMSQWRIIDASIQILVGVLLFIGWVLYLTEVKDMDDVLKFTFKLVERPSIFKKWLAKAICVLVFEAVEILLFFVTAFLTFKEK
jgi:hypothetical protein